MKDLVVGDSSKPVAEMQRILPKGNTVPGYLQPGIYQLFNAPSSTQQAIRSI